MIYNFNSKNKQIVYMSKFIRRHTTLDLLCQCCGKEGKVHNNFIGDPYMIQILCDNCKTLGYKDTKTGMYRGFPLIDVRENIDSSKMKFAYLNRDLVNKIKELPKTKLTRVKALKELGIYSKNTFEKIISEYERLYDKNIRVKIEKRFKENRKEIVKNSKMNSSLLDNGVNNISKIKLKKNISNEEMRNYIKEQYNDNLFNNTISNVSLGKIKPLTKTKCYIAEALGSKLSDVFPEDKNLSFIRSYTDYLILNKLVIGKLKEYIKSNNLTYTTFSKKTNIPIFVFYTIHYKDDYVITAEYMNILVKVLKINKI